MRFTVYSLPLFCSAILMIGLAVFARCKRQTRPETTTFAGLMLASAVYMIGYGLEIMAKNMALKIHLAHLEYLGIVSIPGFWLMMILRYTGRHHLINRRSILLLAIVPIITLSVFFTNGLHHLYYRNMSVSSAGPFPALIFTGGPFYWIYSVYQLLALLSGIFLLVGFLLHTRQIYLRQTLLILTAALIPVITMAIYMMGSPVRGYIDPIAYSLIASSLITAWGILRLRLMNLMPIARDKLVEDLRDGLLVIDDQGHIVDINPAAERFLSLNRRRATGLPSDWVLESFPELIRLCRDPETGTVVIEKDGLSLEAGISPLRTRNDPALGYILLLRDVTRSRSAEEGRLSLERRMHQKQKLESLGLMAGGIAHDFNNLLTVISGNLELALFHLAPDASGIRYSLEQAKGASSQAADLIRLILAYSGKSIFLFKPTDLSLLVKESLKQIQPSLPTDITIRSELPDNLPDIHADQDNLKQVIITLLDNAVEALESKSGAISILTGRMKADDNYLSQSRTEQRPAAGDYVFMEISDTGCGMDDHTLQHLFDPFFSTKATGRGLGMSAVMGIVSAHRGAIVVNSRADEGTTVRVLWPRFNYIIE
ncbi:MAG: histidine kinase N-terminal 7TM domain-containing protein [bacterium]|nr:histidine kinase N-terminal 7TM domain-containing protein [bacterium]